MSFKEFAKNRSNFEFRKEFYRLNNYAPHITLTNGQDCITVHKSFLEGLQEQEEQESSFEFLADNKDLAAEMTDFSDPTAIMRR